MGMFSRRKDSMQHTAGKVYATEHLRSGLVEVFSQAHLPASNVKPQLKQREDMSKVLIRGFKNL